MTDDRPIDFKNVEAVTKWEAKLVGWEPITRPLDRSKPDDEAVLRETWEAAHAADKACELVRTNCGRVAIWQEGHGFWDTEGYGQERGNEPSGDPA